MLFSILLILFIVFLVGGGIGYGRVGYLGWSPAGVILLVAAVLFFTGSLRLH